MVDLEEALACIRRQARRSDPVRLAVHEAIGHVLAEPVRSDVDIPPFDKAMMDGFALRAADAGRARRVIGQATAGGPSAPAVPTGEAVRIMTGAAVPLGADAVVMIEKCEVTSLDGAESMVMPQGAISAEQNIQRKGSLVQIGDVVARRGHLIEAEHLASLIEVGAHQVTAYRRPTVAVLATGDELVSPTAPLGLNQIRNTNGPMLVGLCRERGLVATDLGIGRDDQESLRALIRAGLRAEILLLSGGVSAGDLDLVPRVLADLGVREIFHKVRIKPGKPLWFGIAEQGTLVFGLPGNPVSSLVGFRIFVKAAIDRMSGVEDERPTRGVLETAVELRGDRVTLFPGSSSVDRQGRLTVHPVRWRGSADLSALVSANCLICFEPRDGQYASGEIVPVYQF